LAIETEENARSRGVRIYGYILGYSLLGRSSKGDGTEDIKRSIKMALRGREETPVDYISGAGNSSKALDALEAQGVRKALPDQSSGIPVSSIKSMVGEAIAFGGMRMVTNVLSMEYGFIPPTINYLIPDQVCDLRYVVNQRLDQPIRTILHLGISPEDCFSSILLGVEWSP
jgi:3-oxoacyl-[acyl-carrier-protein] synthase II